LADDAKARKYARLLNVEVIGTLGLLKLAKSRGVITSVKRAIRDMLAEGYYIDAKLVAKLLEDVGEA
jgi:predicted nucleic acid-binding protein